MNACIKIYGGGAVYDKLVANVDGVKKYNGGLNGDGFKGKNQKSYLIKIDGVVLHCLINKLKGCEICRLTFLKWSDEINMFKFFLMPTKIDTIDYNWNEKLDYLVRVRLELDLTLSWLSTLGGAFSALGDYFTSMAETAAMISCHQLKLALRLDDPNIAARCRLYFSLSLIQRGDLRSAKLIIRREFKIATEANVKDKRLIKMCYGIWAKLSYEHDKRRFSRIF